MRLNIDFADVEQVAEKFRSTREFKLELEADSPLEPIDIQLQGGVEVTLQDIESNDGLLSYKGRHVILYIRDHAYRVVDAILDPAKSGKKFHVADCETLEAMRSKNRFDRYVVTQAITGDFEIAGTDAKGSPHQGIARLQVCLNCLKKLNYKSSLLKSSIRKQVRDEFALLEFFETYSTRFSTLPRGVAEQGSGGYTADWQGLSKVLREASGHTCEDCRVCLDDARHLLHVHHINGVKNDNRRSNLQVLCKDCHRKQPSHQHIFLTAKEMCMLAERRRGQGLTPETWDGVLRQADLAVRPSLEIAAHRGWEVPELAIALRATDGSTIHSDAAWARRKLALASVPDTVGVPGWRVQRPGALLRELAADL